MKRILLCEIHLVGQTLCTNSSGVFITIEFNIRTKKKRCLNLKVRYLKSALKNSKLTPKHETN